MIKRLFDILASASLLFLLAPVLLVAAVLVRRWLGAPVLFTQIRPGLFGQPLKWLNFER